MEINPKRIVCVCVCVGGGGGGGGDTHFCLGPPPAPKFAQGDLQLFGPILVTGPNVFIMLKTIKVHSKWKFIEWHSNCTLTAF